MKKLIISPKCEEDKNIVSSLENQKKKLLSVWSGEKCKNYGVLRLIRLFLLIQAFIFPGI